MFIDVQLFAIKSLNRDDFVNGQWIYGIQKFKSNLSNDWTLHVPLLIAKINYVEHFILKLSVITLRVLFLFGFSRYHHPRKTTASTFARSLELSGEENARMDACNFRTCTCQSKRQKNSGHVVRNKNQNGFVPGGCRLQGELSFT